MKGYRSDTPALVQSSRDTFAARWERIAKRATAVYDSPRYGQAHCLPWETAATIGLEGTPEIPVILDDIYASSATVALLEGEHTERALDQILRTALWFDLPHPHGRDPHGESTFAAMGLLPALYYCEKKLTPAVRKAVDRFFLSKNFESMYESENHRLQHHTALFLAGQYYADRVFTWRGQRGRDFMEAEAEWLKRFIRYRAKRSWGEFDACGYLGVDFCCLLLLADLAGDEELAVLSHMMLDVLLLDMAVDSKNGLYGGAHGRIYPENALNAGRGDMQGLYALFVGAPGLEENPVKAAALFSRYRPSDAVLEVALGRCGSYENREAKHLHCIPEGDQPGRISKYTYVAERYVVGAVNRQDPYTEGSQQGWYAHHQQHEMDALILADPRAKLFTHHPGKTGEHNRWTGDLGCGCVQTFAWHSVVMAMYDIVKEDEPDWIHAHFNRRVLRHVQMRGHWVFGELDGVYAALYGSHGWQWAEEETAADAEHEVSNADLELVSCGRRHGCVIELSDTDESLDAFIRRILSNTVRFEPGRSLSYTTNGHTLAMDGETRTVDGVPERFPYAVYDCPYLQSEWDDSKIRVNGFSGPWVYDFENANVTAGAGQK